MKILQVCPKYYPFIGGVDQHVRNISERLVHEHEVTVFTCDPSGQLPREELLNGVKIWRFRSFSPQDAYHISLSMLRELRHSSFDVVHGHSYHAFPLLFSRYAKRKRFIITSHYHGHGSTKLREVLFKGYKPFGQTVMREADVVIAVSQYEKALLVKDFKIADKVLVIPNGIEVREFKTLKPCQKTHMSILSVGRLEEYKGIQFIIQALPLLNKNIHLNIVGSGSYKEKLIDFAKTLGVKDRVEFHHDLSKSELLAKYVNADLFVLLSKYEAFGIVVAEALAARVPCVVANTSALTEWIDNQNCFGIDYPISVERLAQLINDTIGQAVGDVKLWDWDDVVAETLKVYKG